MSDVILVAGLGFGDEGKGTMVDYLALTSLYETHTIVRYNGGAQSAHNVVTNDGCHHTFAQFGAGTFAGARTHLSRHMLVNPITLDTEAEALIALGFDCYDLLTVEREALVTTTYHIAANRIREVLRGKDRHGSCGLGIGETVADSIAYPDMAIRVGDLTDRETLRRKLQFVRERKHAEFSNLEGVPAEMLVFEPDRIDYYVNWYSALGEKLHVVDRDYLPTLLARKNQTIIFEGAQGVLLDETYGFHPHTTWSNTTFGNAMDLLQGFDGPVRKIGVLRGYMTRHGAGPFPTELARERGVPISCNLQTDLHNPWGPFQQHLRLGHFDAVLARYALDVIGGVDELAITNLDKLGPYPKICTHYWWPTETSYVREPLRRLSVLKKPSLEHQEQLGRDLITKAEPAYENLNSRIAIVDRIESELGIPVKLASVGPKRLHKYPAEHLQDLRAAQWNY